MFALNNKTVTITNVNGRHEKHGDENVLACDLEIKGDFSGDILAEFAPALRSCMYEKNPDADLADQGQDVPTALRFPKLGMPLKWDAEIVGATVTLDYGIGHIALSPANVNKFRMELNEGGTCTVMFRIQANTTEEQLAKLFGVLDTKVPVTIEPPQADVQSEIEEEGQQQQGAFAEIE